MGKAPSTANKNATDRTWLAGPVGVYHKFSWEFGQAYDLLNDQQDLTPAQYQAMNACITAWSLVDWICADMDERNAWEQFAAVSGVKDSASFRQKARLFRELSTCQQIANAAKHRSLGKGYQPGYSVHDELIPCEEDGKVHFMRRMTVRFPRGEFDIRIVLHEVYNWWGRTLVELGYLP